MSNNFQGLKKKGAVFYTSIRRFIKYYKHPLYMQEKIDFDIEKLKPEDRRFLMSRSLSVASTNATNRLTNTSLIISHISMLIALFSLVFSIQNGFTNIVLTVLIIEIIFLIILLVWYFSAQKKVANQTKAAEDGHNVMFKKHFEYAKKK
jgi:hypothetical protein